MSRDPRIDDQIAKAPEWAAAILSHLRDLVHRGAPGVTEDIKWGRPFFLLDGRMFAMMASFKAHAVFGFTRIGKPEKETEGGGQYGKLTSIADLPDDAAMIAAISEAADAMRTRVPTKRIGALPKPALDIPPDFAVALAAAPSARSGFERLPPGARRDYLEWILAAKRPETRARRIETALAQLAEGRKLNWKYEAC